MPSGIYKRTEKYKKAMKAVWQREGYREKQSLAHKGYKHSKETKKKLSLIAIKQGLGKNNRKPDIELAYTTLHIWVARRKKRTGTCEKCGKKGYTEWANKSGEYKRDVNDYWELCHGCNLKDGVAVHPRFSYEETVAR